jgi:hypothetical protein
MARISRDDIVGASLAVPVAGILSVVLGANHNQVAVLVKRNGLLGTAYIAAIRPFRHVIVDPRLLREIGRRWPARAAPG